jgi:hypothetical protein
MRWRMLIELTGSDGIVRLHEVVAGGDRPVDPLADSPIGLTLAERKTILAGVQADWWKLRLLPTEPRSGNSGDGGCARRHKDWRRR